MNFFDGRKLVSQFNIGSRVDIENYEKILNDPRCRVIEKVTSTSKLGEVIVYIEYIDSSRRQVEK